MSPSTSAVVTILNDVVLTWQQSNAF